MSMAEIQPQFTYSPDGVLTLDNSSIDLVEWAGNDVLRNLYDLRDLEERRARAMDWMASRPGVEITEGIHPKIEVPIREAINEAIKGRDNSVFTTFVGSLSLLTLQQSGPDVHNRVMTIAGIGDRGIHVDVYQHFQGWLNNNGLSEEAAKDCTIAVATAYNEEETEEREFQYHNFNNGVFAGTIAVRIIARLDAFRFQDFHEGNGSTLLRQGEDRWKWLSLDTYGDPSIAVAGETRRKVRYVQDNKKLYRMYSHNIDSARQSLSLLLGLGSLAYHAAQDQQEYDVFKDVAWEKSEKWSYPIPDFG